MHRFVQRLHRCSAITGATRCTDTMCEIASDPSYVKRTSNDVGGTLYPMQFLCATVHVGARWFGYCF
jgi:hypothetical protein